MPAALGGRGGGRGVPAAPGRGGGRGGGKNPTGLAAELNDYRRALLGDHDDGNDNYVSRRRGAIRTPRNVDQSDLLDRMNHQVSGNIHAVMRLASAFAPPQPPPPSRLETLQTMLERALSRKRTIAEFGGTSEEEDDFIRMIRRRIQDEFDDEFPERAPAQNPE